MKVKEIQSLARGLDVLQVLQGRGSLTLQALHDATGIPKASLLRILKTLIARGMVWQRMVDGAYVPSYSFLNLAGRMDREIELVEVASPILVALTDEVKWPSVLAVPRLSHMEVIETNAPRAEMDHIPLGPLGFQINMLRSAAGRAYLAFCEPAVRDAILDRLRRSGRPGDQLARNDDYVARMLAETRARGYALRDPDFGGDFDRERARADDGRESLGVAIRLGAHVPATINVTWTRRALGRGEAAERFAAPVMRAAEAIADRLAGRHETNAPDR